MRMIRIMKLFSELKIDKRIVKSLEEMGFIEMTEVQAKSIPAVLDGKDVIAQSITGSGKTAAFGVPICEAVKRGNGIQAIIIGPTRELVNQVSDEMKKFGKHKELQVSTIFGGVSMEPQYRSLKSSEIVVGTPGRMLDHMRRGTLKLNRVKITVLDEADRMLDMGFIDDIRTILSHCPSSRQTMLFSATMPQGVVRIADRFMRNSIKIEGERLVSQHLLKQYYYDISEEEKLSLLKYLIEKEKPELAIVFCATRGKTNYVARFLEHAGVEAKAIHGGMGQGSRMDVLRGFHKGRPHILVATDVAARGLDIKNVSHIFNYNIPKTVEDYTHRIGRTARFGKKGETISLLSREDHAAFRKIVTRIDINKMEKPEDFHPKKVFSQRYRQPQRRGGFGQRKGFGHSRRGPKRRGFGRRSGFGRGHRRRY